MKAVTAKLPWLQVKRGGWRAHLGLGVAIALFAGLALYGVQRLSGEREEIRVAHESGSWVIVQAEFELVRFIGALDRFALNSPDVSHDELVSRYDILFSRLPLLIEGPNADLVRPVEGLAATAQQLLATLKSLESSVLNLRPDDGITYQAIRGRVAPFEKPWHDFTLDAMVGGAVFYDGERPNQTLYLTMVAFLGLLVSGGVMVAILRQRIREARQLAWDLETERDTWQRAGHRLGDAIEALPQAFAMFDADDRLVLCNQHFRAFLAIGGDADPVGQTLEQLLRRCAAAALYAMDGDEKLEALVARHLVYHSAYGRFEFALADGRRMRSEERETADGGKLVVLTDVTDAQARVSPRKAGAADHPIHAYRIGGHRPDRAYAVAGRAQHWR
jgi:PAS domain-containing protein